MITVVAGTICGPFLLLKDVDGHRHAMRPTAVLAVSEMDGGEAVLTLHGGRSIHATESLDDVLGWLERPTG